jgi:hypothetical protein
VEELLIVIKEVINIENETFGQEITQRFSFLKVYELNGGLEDES